MQHFDIIVIGAGSGGLNIASFMNSIGLSVLLIDRSAEHIGGDCLNTGCVPSKALIHAARICKAAKEATRYGIQSTGQVDLGAVMSEVREKQAIIREHENVEYFRSKGMTVVLGDAHFAGHDTVQVCEVVYRGKKIIIATGSRPRLLTIPGVEMVEAAGRLHTNETIFSQSTLPKNLLVVGAGPIGIELGQAFAHLGSAVSIVTNDATILPREDKVVSSVLQTQLVNDGLQFHFNSQTLRFEHGNQLVIKDNQSEQEKVLSFDAVLVSIGRVLNTETLALAKAGITCDAQGKIKVDKYLRTINKRIFVCGDVLGQHQFTHAAELHARVIIKNLLTPLFKTKLSTNNLSWVTYTTPELATYGQNEVELQKQRIPYTVLETSFVDDDRAITADAQYGYTKMFVHAKTKQILGGTMVAPQAGELIQELVLAVTHRLPTSAIFNKIYPYPTASRINKYVVTIGERARLTPTTIRVMRLLYRLGL